MTEWAEEVADINELLLDRQIFACDGEPVGKVDDLEFTDVDEGGAPVLTAILCGPTALGPRIGGLLGLLWWSAGRRLGGPEGRLTPVRIPFEEVEKVDRREVRLRAKGDDVGTRVLRNWTRDKIVSRIPGGPS